MPVKRAWHSHSKAENQRERLPSCFGELLGKKAKVQHRGPNCYLHTTDVEASNPIQINSILHKLQLPKDLEVIVDTAVKLSANVPNVFQRSV
jgi:hypothetical protein